MTARRREPKAAKAYDYVQGMLDQFPLYQARDSDGKDIRRILRKLVKDAAVRAIVEACEGAGCTGKESPNETGTRIAKALVP